MSAYPQTRAPTRARVKGTGRSLEIRETHGKGPPRVAGKAVARSRSLLFVTEQEQFVISLLTSLA